MDTYINVCWLFYRKENKDYDYWFKNELSNAKQLTENGAVGYRTTGKELLDLNFMTSSLRNKSEDEIFDSFLRAFTKIKC